MVYLKVSRGSGHSTDTNRVTAAYHHFRHISSWPQLIAT